MRKIDINEMQHIELDLLKVFDTICKKHNLRYYIDGGTLLGAMCYEGFIPWDDDIDLKMPRPDYDMFASYCSELPSHVSLIVPSRDICIYTMSKLIDNRTVLIEKQGLSTKTTGVYIDILPMDGHPDNNDNHFRCLQKYNSLFHYSLSGFSEQKKSSSLFKRMKGHLYSVIYTPWKIYCRLTELARKYEYDKCRYVGLVIEGDYLKERYEREELDNSVYLQFEDMSVPASADYESHLQQFYGNHINKKECYHNLPYIAPAHNYEVYWKD